MKNDSLIPVETALVSARKYRPGLFSEVLSQEHVSTTLRNAIVQGRLSHAYLFAGPRGVGKTTMARILAKAVNCSSRDGAEPCDECDMCVEIREGRALDIIEIDGASNRRIADVRDLRQKVGYAPGKATTKVYIIDEVHMLTNEAFNALLKTLEEPPDRVMFIFATTEPRKVPLTILSRCQRFDFREVGRSAIAAYLSRIAGHEGLELSEETRYAIARKAKGSLRDALSLFDQLRAFAGGGFDANDVFVVTGMVEDELYVNLLKGIAAGEGKTVIGLLGRVALSGIDLCELYDGLIEHIRNLIVLMQGDEQEDVFEVPDSIIAEYRDILPQFETARLFDMFDRLSLSRELFRNSELKRVMLETMLLRFISLEKDTGGGRKSPEKVSRGNAAGKVKNEGSNPRKNPGGKVVQSSDATEIWRFFMETIRRKKVTLFGLLARAEPLAFDGEMFTLRAGCMNSFTREQLEHPAHVSLMNECMSSVCGKNVFLKIRFDEEGTPPVHDEECAGADTTVDDLRAILDAEEIDHGA